MNFALHNQDLRVLQTEAAKPRFGRAPGWTRVDWKPTPSGGNIVFLRRFALPPTCSAPHTDVKIEAPPNLYESVGRGQLMFYRNLWISPDIRLFDRKSRQWLNMPRLHGCDADGFAYLCLHPDPVKPGKNILDFLRVLDLFLLNPGYKAAGWEKA